MRNSVPRVCGVPDLRVNAQLWTLSSPIAWKALHDVMADDQTTDDRFGCLWPQSGANQMLRALAIIGYSLAVLRLRLLARQGHTANGAGIAADPTLTCAWALRSLRFRRASPSSTSFSLRTWQPVSNPRPAASSSFHSCELHLSVAALLRGSSPALAPASDFALLFVFAPFGPRSSLCSASKFSQAETTILFLTSRTLKDVCSKALSYSYCQPLLRP